MADCIHTLFSAWGLDDSDGRAAKTDAVIGADFAYTDPSLEGFLTGRDAYLTHIARFGEKMPGASVHIVDVSESNGFARATVDCLAGGKAMMRGQYFAEIVNGKVARLVGFTGTGSPE